MNEQEKINQLFEEMSRIVVGQRDLMEKLLVALLAKGHILIEGLPGLAKTLVVKIFAQLIHAEFNRIQFTSDMLPADLTGTLMFDQKTGEFKTWKGPIFTNILLTDEINRAPAKVQGALLEVMEERQVTIGDMSFEMSEPFFVLATQNPMDQSGTYALPESQLDRFMFNVHVTYPTRSEEKEIMRAMARTDMDLKLDPILELKDILAMRKLINQVEISDKVEQYLLDIIEATRHPQKFDIHELKDYVQYGASPRATIHLNLASKSYAFCQGRDYVKPQDVEAMAQDVLRHRIIPSYRAQGEGIDADQIIRTILTRIDLP